MSEYLGEVAVRAHEARVEALSQMFEDVELQGKELSSAMQEFNSRIFTHRLYHEAPNDVFELTFLHLSVVGVNGRGKGGLNVMRLVNKRCMRVVESVATRLTGDKTVTTLPISALKRCRGIEHIRCHYLESLEGCPDGLKSLYLADGHILQSLEPLSALLLEELDLWHGVIKDISPLSQCKKLKMLNIGYAQGIKDLSLLCQCPDLEKLDISYLNLIKDFSFFEKGFPKLRVLNISQLSVDDLSPLTKLQSLEALICYGIPPTTSLLPFARCDKLMGLECSRNASDLVTLRERRPDMKVVAI